MTVEQCYSELGEDYTQLVNRFGNASILHKFLLKFPADQSFNDLTSALNAGDGESAFRAAHTLKGVCLNLGFDALHHASTALTEQLRGYDVTGTDALYQEVKNQYERVIGLIAQVGAEES